MMNGAGSPNIMECPDNKINNDSEQKKYTCLCTHTFYLLFFYVNIYETGLVIVDSNNLFSKLGTCFDIKCDVID